MWLVRLAAAVVLILALSGTSPGSVSAANCQFVLGFAALDALIPSIVGNCLDNEHFNVANGDALQDTSGVNGAVGLLVWRKADNWTAYTDGYHTWINGPYGLQERLNTDRLPWETDSHPTAIPTQAPTPLPAAPTLNCGPWQGGQIGVGGYIVYSEKADVAVGYGIYGNLTVSGSDQTIDFSIKDSNGSTVWGSKTFTISGLFIFEAKYPDKFTISLTNWSPTQKTIVLNWRVCQNP